MVVTDMAEQNSEIFLVLPAKPLSWAHWGFILRGKTVCLSYCRPEVSDGGISISSRKLCLLSSGSFQCGSDKLDGTLSGCLLKCLP